MSKHYWNQVMSNQMNKLAKEGKSSTEVAKEMNISFDTMCYHARKEGVKFKRKDMNGIPKRRLEYKANIPILSYNTEDPRSLVCQGIRVCNGQGCHRKDSCPAFQAFDQKVGIYV